MEFTFDMTETFPVPLTSIICQRVIEYTNFQVSLLEAPQTERNIYLLQQHRLENINTFALRRSKVACLLAHDTAGLRLLNSPSMVVLGLSVGYETWPQICSHHSFVIGWCSTIVSVAMNCGFM